MSDVIDTLRKSLPAAKSGSWYSIKNQADKVAVRIYEEIGYWGVTAADFAADLDAITANEIEVQISSPGGDVFDGIAIYNALRAHPATITTRVDGLAASAASVIVQAGDRRVMLSASQMMIHNAWGLTVGSADDMRDAADILERQNEVLAGIYAARSGRDAGEFKKLMSAETWLTDQGAVDAGLADEVIDTPQSALRVPQSLFVAKAMASLPDNQTVAVELESQEVGQMADESIPKADHDAVVAERDAITAERDALQAQLSELTPEAKDDRIDVAALPEPVQAALREADALKARVEKMEQDNRAKAFLAKAAEFASIAPATDLAPVLETLDRVAPEQAKALDQALKAANARINESGLFKELGSDADVDGDRQAKAEALIKQRMTEDNLPRHEAMAKVFKDNPELLYPAPVAAQ